MAFAINQNFDLKSKRKDFVRQELTLADLKTTREADYPDDYTVTIGGKIYIFNSSNSVDSILGKWREFAGGGGGSITPGSGLENTSGTLRVKIGSGIAFNSTGGVKVDCPDVNDESVKTTHFAPLKIGSSSNLGIHLGTYFTAAGDKIELHLGSGLETSPDNSAIKVAISNNSPLSIDSGKLNVKIGSGLTLDGANKISLSSCTVYRRYISDPIAQDSVIVSTNGVLNFKISTGLAVDEDGHLYVDVNSIINV